MAIRFFAVFCLLLQLASALVLSDVRGAAALRRRSAASPVMKASAFKTGDMVEVITGDDKGETGKIISIDAKKGKVMVEGINMQSKHVSHSRRAQTPATLTTRMETVRSATTPANARRASLLAVRWQMKPMKEGETGRIMKRECAIHISNIKRSDAAPAPAA